MAKSSGRTYNQKKEFFGEVVCLSKKAIIITATIILLAALLGGCKSGPPGTEEGKLPALDITGQEESEGTLVVSFIDCGQGDAILIKSPTDEYMLIDAGTAEAGATVCAFLREEGVEKLNAVVGTHPHSDHIGGLTEVLDSFPAEAVYMPRVTHDTKTFENLVEAIQRQNLKITTARSGGQIPLEGLQAYFLAPVGDDYDEMNNYSAVIRIDYGANSFIFTGDAEELSEQEMLQTKQNLVADVLKVGHHGSVSSTSPEFLRAVRPQHAVIMCGQDNDYGHPHEETMKALNDAGIEIYRTDTDGTITMTSDGQNIIVVQTKDTDIAQSAPASAPVAAPVNEDNQTQYIGNKKSLKFHRDDCGGLPVEANRVYLEDRDEFIRQGYSPCGNCQP